MPPSDSVPPPAAALPLAVTVRKREDGVTVLSAVGAVDPATLPLLVQELSAAIDSGNPPRLVLDLSGVRHVSTSGWGALIGRLRTIRERKGTLRVSGLPKSVLAGFTHLGLQLHIPHFPTLDEALGAPW